MKTEKIYGLIGRKLSHSDSAPIHDAFGRADYRLLEIEPDEIGAFLNTPGLAALNVTIPYKRAVIPYLTDLSPEAARVGGVNTIVFSPDGRRTGYNTDVSGFAYTVRRLGADVSGEKALVFGSGGAGAAAKVALKDLGAREVVVVSRKGSDNYGNLSRHADAGILVNATPVGMYPNPDGAIVDPGAFPCAKAAFDLVYNPLRTDFLRLAERAGIPAAGGLSMLVAQARRAEELFSGDSIPESENERVLLRLTREKTSVALIGMPGSGKSAIGAALGALTGRPVADTDDMIERDAGKSAAEIIRSEGLPAFRERERKAVREASLLRGAIIVTGGGAVLREDNRVDLRRNARVYRIIRDLNALPREGRPLSENADLFEMARSREEFYRAAGDVEILNDETVEAAAIKIRDEFLSYTARLVFGA